MPAVCWLFFFYLKKSNYKLKISTWPDRTQFKTFESILKRFITKKCTCLDKNNASNLVTWSMCQKQAFKDFSYNHLFILIAGISYLLLVGWLGDSGDAKLVLRPGDWVGSQLLMLLSSPSVGSVMTEVVAVWLLRWLLPLDLLVFLILCLVVHLGCLWWERRALWNRPQQPHISSISWSTWFSCSLGASTHHFSLHRSLGILWSCSLALCM
jgi:hypothetical protein